MKKSIIIFASIALLISCSDKKKTNSSNSTSAESTTSTNNSEDEKTGSFTFDGKTVTGNVSIQYFGSDKEKSNFSVLCQHNEGDNANPNFELLQITFNNEKEATTTPSLKIYKDGAQLPMTEPESGIVSVALSGVGNNLDDLQFTGSNNSTGGFSVSNRTITITELSLFNSKGEKRVVSAKIPL